MNFLKGFGSLIMILCWSAFIVYNGQSFQGPDCYLKKTEMPALNSNYQKIVSLRMFASKREFTVGRLIDLSVGFWTPEQGLTLSKDETVLINKETFHEHYYKVDCKIPKKSL